jgi:hypothetical protein
MEMDVTENLATDFSGFSHHPMELLRFRTKDNATSMPAPLSGQKT